MEVEILPGKVITLKEMKNVYKITTNGGQVSHITLAATIRWEWVDFTSVCKAFSI